MSLSPNSFTLSQSEMLSLLHGRGGKKAPINFLKLLRLEKSLTLAKSAASQVSSKATKDMVEALHKRAAGVRSLGQAMDAALLPPMCSVLLPASGLWLDAHFPPSLEVERARDSPVHPSVSRCSRQDCSSGATRSVPAMAA